MAKKIFSMLGRSGAGKSEVGKFLVEKYGIPIISTGLIFKESSNANPVIDKLLKEGKFIPPEIAKKIIKDWFDNNKNERGYIVDGAPRNVEQVNDFWKNILHGATFVLIDTDYEVCKERMLSRGRGDDVLANIESRLKEFELLTVPAIQLIKEKLQGKNDRFLRVDGNQPLADVKKFLAEFL